MNRLRKGSIKKKKAISPAFFLIISSIFLTGVILVGVYLFSTKRGTEVSWLFYEENFSTTTCFTEALSNLDYTLYESLYQSGTKKNDIFFLSVRPRHQNGYIWDFTEFLVQSHDVHSALNLQKVIAQGLAALGREIDFKKEKAPEGLIVYHFFVRGLYTHKMVIALDGRRPSKKGAKPKIAFVIDDLGYDLDMALSFIRLDLPLSLSVLPSAPFTEIIVREANKEGREIILHLPMEPKRYPSVDPGPGTLFVSMGESEINGILDQNLSDMPGIRGVNNHMGSRFTEDSEKMFIVLQKLKKKGLFYIDSRTTSKSVGFQMAKKMGLPTAERSVFLDNDLAPKTMKVQMERLLSMARHKGSAIGIGHPFKETLGALEEYRSEIKAEFRLAPVSELVD